MPMESRLWCVNPSLKERLLCHFDASNVNYKYPTTDYPDGLLEELSDDLNLDPKDIKPMLIDIDPAESNIAKAYKVFDYVSKSFNLVNQLNNLYKQ